VAVLGVDACRAGWAGVCLDGDDVTGLFATDLETLVRQATSGREIECIGVDMPIGLPDSGHREADELARKVVGPQWRSVFMTPVRAALLESTYEGASRMNRKLTGEGISRQAFSLRPRLLEVDRWVTDPRVRVIEIHPELSFRTMANQVLVERKKTWAGMVRRRSLLERTGIRFPQELGDLGTHAAVDDVLDAAAAAWSARRCDRGEADSYPDPPQRFSDGLDCAIRA
jgi:predicted RNase H-like nuclease